MDVVTTPPGGTISGAQSQGGFGTNVAWGEVFKWAGSANGDQLSGYSMVVNYENSGRLYQPVLLDLGTGTFNTTGSSFNPSLHPNLLSTMTITLPSTPERDFVEFDYTGTDAAVLTVGHSYAIGLWNQDPNAAGGDIYFQRDSGFQGDANGMPFQTGKLGLNDPAGTCPGWGGGPRNILFALYTTQVPEPSTLALFALGLVGALAIRRKG